MQRDEQRRCFHGVQGCVLAVDIKADVLEAMQVACSTLQQLCVARYRRLRCSCNYVLVAISCLQFQAAVCVIEITKMRRASDRLQWSGTSRTFARLV